MPTSRRTTTRTTVRVESDRGVFMISVAAELAEMHPQTLRMYEARGLITPKRSPKGTRLYSHEDVERLRRIQQMTTEFGLNLAGVEKVMELELKLERAIAKVDALERRAEELREEVAGLEAKRDRVRTDLVRYEHSREIARAEDVRPIKLRVQRPDR
jgi:MerR family transcriptional regulator/heat shock protein HspR